MTTPTPTETPDARPGVVSSTLVYLYPGMQVRRRLEFGVPVEDRMSALVAVEDPATGADLVLMCPDAALLRVLAAHVLLAADDLDRHHADPSST